MVDIYSQSGDPDLASLSGTTKQLTLCQDHNNPKEYYHPTTRMTLCAQCLVDKDLDRKDT